MYSGAKLGTFIFQIQNIHSTSIHFVIPDLQTDLLLTIFRGYFTSLRLTSHK